MFHMNNLPEIHANWAIIHDFSLKDSLSFDLLRSTALHKNEVREIGLLGIRGLFSSFLVYGYNMGT